VPQKAVYRESRSSLLGNSGESYSSRVSARYLLTLTGRQFWAEAHLRFRAGKFNEKSKRRYPDSIPGPSTGA
jgi:hypothetical protein